MSPDADAAEVSSPPASLLDLPVRDLLAATAARTPAPGGGAVAALVTALAAGLVAMTARFGAEDELVARAEDLRRQVEPLADADGAAYGRFLAATRRPPEPDPQARREAVAAALTEANEIPLRIAEIAADTAELAAALARTGNPNLRGDAATAALLAAAAAGAAAILVTENLRRTPDDRRMARAAASADRARAAAAEVLG